MGMTKVKRKIDGLRRRARTLLAQRVVLPESAPDAKVRVEHDVREKGARLMLVGQREAIMTGQPVCDYICTEPTVIQVLAEEGRGTWMTDLPCELVQMHALAAKARGTVLVGGLGLGIVARMCAQRKQVQRVAVIESSPDVVEAVWPALRELLPAHVRGKIDVYTQDVHEHAAMDVDYDVALLDTWQGTGEMVWTGDVVPLRRALNDKVDEIHCWHEEVMLAQVHRGLMGAATVVDPAVLDVVPHYYAFARALDAQGVDRERADPRSEPFAGYWEAREKNARNPEIDAMARVMMERPGSFLWERWFGAHWDEAVTKVEKAREEQKEGA